MAADVRATALYAQVAHKDFGEVQVTHLYAQVAHKDFGEVQVTALYVQVCSTYGDLDEPLPTPPSTAVARRIVMVMT